MLAPIAIYSFYYYGITPTLFGGTSISSQGEVGWVLIYVGISVGIGLISGMITSTVIRCLDIL